jgi:serine/threonine protein kinase
MEFKIFLGKYRVAHDEMALAAPPAADDALGAETLTPVSETPATAAVYRGVEIDSGRDVAVEVIPAFSLKRAARERLEAEALAARKINHINIPALYDFGVEDDHLVYVTEYFDGTSAEEWVNAHGPMPTGAVFRIALQVVGAMGVASIHKISHHALNPANLILVPGQTPEGDWPLVKVSHFVGVAPTFSSADSSVASFDKSSHYASPEQLQGGPVDFRSEIYSLGASMWFLLTGAPPLTTSKGAGAVQPATVGRAADKLNGMPKKVRRLLAQMLSANPEARPQEPLAFYRQIQESLAQVDRRETMARKLGVPFLSGSKTAALPSRRPFRTKLVALAAIVIAIAAIASISIASYLRHQRIRQAAEPIGKPIGVSEPVVGTAPPVTAIAIAPTIAPAPPQPEQTTQTTVAQKNQAPPVVASAPAIKPLPSAAEQTAPATVVEQNQPPPVSDSTAVAAANNQAAAPPPQPSQSETTVTSEPPTVAANEPKPVIEERSKPATKLAPEVREEKSKPSESEVAVAARPVNPEVRRAESAEGPEDDVAVSRPTEKKSVTVAKPKKERARKPSPVVEEEAIPRAEPVEREEQIVEEPAPRRPGSRTRARFIGVTPEGDWMFSLPNKKIVIMPPPPGG